MIYHGRYNTRHIPTGAVEIPHALGVCYTRELAGRFEVIAYAGKANKPSFYEMYRKPETRDERITRFFTSLEQHDVQVRERRVKRSVFYTLQVGDILHYSWGYDQTNCDFFQVVSTTKNTVTLREIGSRTVPGSEVSHGMADKRAPVPDVFYGEPITKRVSGDNYVSMDNGCASKCSRDSSFYCSWYA